MAATSSFQALVVIKFSPGKKKTRGRFMNVSRFYHFPRFLHRISFSLSSSRRQRANLQGEDTHLQAAAVVHGGLQGYPGDKDPVIPVDTVALAYVETEGLSRSFDYLDEVDGVLRILKRRSPANFLNSCRRDISQRLRARPEWKLRCAKLLRVVKIIFSRGRAVQM